MRICVFLILSVCFAFTAGDKNPFFPAHLQHTEVAKLKEIDSLTYYQCQVLQVARQQLTGSDGKLIELGAKDENITITEKFTLYRNKDDYRLKYYTSSATFYPNKKYAYLKLVEKKYWNFELKKDVVLDKKDVLLLAAYETKLREVTEYDFTVKKNNSPQLILNGRKISGQYIVGGSYLLKNTLSALQ